VRLGVPEEKENLDYKKSASDELTVYLHNSIEEVQPASWEIDLVKFLFFKKLILRNVYL